MTETVGARTLIVDFLAFSRRRSAGVIGLIAAGAVLEGAGVLLLVPILSLILGGGGDTLAGPVFAVLGLEDMTARTLFVLGAFAVLMALRFRVLLLRDDALVRLQQDFVVDLRGRAFRRLAAMSWAELADLRQGPTGHALTRDVDRVGFGVGMIVQGGVSVIMLAVQLGLALALAPAVTAIVTVLGLALFRALRWLRERAEGQGSALTEGDLALYQSVGGFLDGLKPAKAHGLEQDYAAAFDRAARGLAAEERRFAWDYTLARLLMQTAAGGIAILAVLLGIFVLGTPPESLVVTLVILARLYSPLQALQNSLQALRHAAAGYRLAREIAGPAGQVTGPLPAATSAAEPLTSAPAIEFIDTGWHPSGGTPVLDSISLRFPAGEVIGIGGESGAGKSTLCDLAVGLLAPTSGRVLVDGAALDAALVARLRASVAYVGQEPFLFEDTLRRNLTWGCGEAPDTAIWQALEIVGAAGIACGLDGALDGRVRAGGAPFSGGERQRLRLARALLRRPRLLVLDEATNALDLGAEAQVLAAVLGAIRRAPGGATVLMVSHRPQTLGLADRIVTLAGGRLPEMAASGAMAARTAAIIEN